MRCRQHIGIIIGILCFAIGVIAAFFLPAAVLCIILACLLAAGCLVSLSR